MSGVFDSAVFDSAVFDTGDAVAEVSQKRLWQFYRDKRDRENAAKVLDPQIEAIPAPEHTEQVFTPVMREADWAVVTDAPYREAQLAELQAQREAHEIQQRELAAVQARIKREIEDEEAARALLAWLLS